MGGGAVVAVDVDGVLAIDPGLVAGGQALTKLGYRPYEFDGLSPDGRPAVGTVWLNPAHGVWLRELLNWGAELAWATSWGVRAADWIAPRLELPEMPVIEVPNAGPAFGWSAKVGPILQWVANRPLAWLDDQYGGKEYGWAEDRRDDGIPTLIVSVGAGRGLTRQHVDDVITWLATDVANYLGK
ncbi:hypothetical protein ALI144C_52510 [Actinosynnema sp. ALI-1.44]|uniref:hypothetical protein n=1 Tax=Actinosynnema sp. ALI-1.44 TaxID=1933779 RepID=UPI00097CBCA5|nr:hypothetical protein [Actinosynnema sp. ALI-1.44]ONI71153.1 hypothetical protein ALI144C_52510 [Actinosynnema sp. ALI-1.44]